MAQVGYKRLKLSSEKTFPRQPPYLNGYRSMPSSRVVNYSDPFVLSNQLEELDGGKYGSVTKELEALCGQRRKLMDMLLVDSPPTSTVEPSMDLPTGRRRSIPECNKPNSDILIILDGDPDEEVAAPVNDQGLNLSHSSGGEVTGFSCDPVEETKNSILIVNSKSAGQVNEFGSGVVTGVSCDPEVEGNSNTPTINIDSAEGVSVFGSGTTAGVSCDPAVEGNINIPTINIESVRKMNGFGSGAVASVSCGLGDEGKAIIPIINIDSDDEEGSDLRIPGKAVGGEINGFKEWLKSEVQKRVTSHSNELEYYSNLLVHEPYAVPGDFVSCNSSVVQETYQPTVQYESINLGGPAARDPGQVVTVKDRGYFRIENTDFVRYSRKTKKRGNGEMIKERKIDAEAEPSPSVESPEHSFSPESQGADDVEDDGLNDLWRECSLAMEYTKDSTANDTVVVQKGEEECNHSCLLKDDLGYVCRICGVIQKSIETIFDFQWIKGTKTSTRTYAYGSQNTKESDQNESQIFGLKEFDNELAGADISVHPRHSKQMRSHQIEGFNFLYPHARPLIVLPKGILATWKKEFDRWQVEEIPIFDLYAVKLRSQQLEVLDRWIEVKSILFCGYKQFSTIVCGSTSCKTTAACRERLLKVPSLLIIDEGHTPRNEDTDVLDSLAKVQTRCKVVLSGTLFQNHVKEVFNILNLVRPRFTKTDSSRAIINRIMSKVQINRKQCKSGADAVFFDSVEDTLKIDGDLKRKITVIQDLRELTRNVLHYYKGDFLEELPGIIDYTVLLNLSPKQKDAIRKLDVFEKFKRSAVGGAVYMHPCLKEMSMNAAENRDKGNTVIDAKIGEILTRMDIKDGVKTKFVLSLLSLCESSGEKLLVFSAYLLPLKFLERLVAMRKGWRTGKEMFVISGDSSADYRETAMDLFNNSSEAKILFGSIKACGEGISLVGASRVVILDVHLNPSVTRQAIGRAFRPGQTKKVFVYRLVAAESPEEEDQKTSLKKELTSKMWFEWSEHSSNQNFQMDEVSVDDCEDVFMESPVLREDIKVLYRR
ncbi:DNA repair and recombination protein RAD54 [Acorus gramineus]|uniref:DNA repair and recombination protein RAD54 n=1 Tax=Acorus gramineus TaxID=55184 RepID=A0AAV9AG59_ACOGR|nr:DNA repair and recombination protein RAD54 [Acorus gramineus]